MAFFFFIAFARGEEFNKELVEYNLTSKGNEIEPFVELLTEGTEAQQYLLDSIGIASQNNDKIIQKTERKVIKFIEKIDAFYVDTSKLNIYRNLSLAKFDQVDRKLRLGRGQLRRLADDTKVQYINEVCGTGLYQTVIVMREVAYISSCLPASGGDKRVNNVNIIYVSAQRILVEKS